MRRILSAFGGLILAVLLSQFPEYAQQYTQRLGGAVDELRVLIAEFDTAASEAGLSRQQALARYTETNDSFIVGRGQSMTRTFARYEQLSEVLAELRGSSGWERFQQLPRYLDTEIGRRTMENFQPGVPVTLEGLAYAGAGFLGGYLIVSALVTLVLLPFRAFWRRRRERRYAPDPSASV
ncbi:DUF2937 family protein [Devosia sp.]|uniref:DUF2937 family protein n=1 Tax=Devosia sp. TaxID=1871048 RepID=UPI003A95294B